MWKHNELEEFTVLADDDTAFGVSLEKLVLKKLLITKYSLK